MPGREAAPGRLELVRQFVNTLALEGGRDELPSAAALSRWLAERGLVPARTRARRDDLARAVAVRGALRVLLVANGGGRVDPDAPAVLEAAARWGALTLRFGPDGAAALEPARGGIGGGVGRLLAIVAESMAAGTWPRLKACRSETCRRAFYDRSAGRSRAWCSMATCGNRAKVRSYRARRAG